MGSSVDVGFIISLVGLILQFADLKQKQILVLAIQFNPIQFNVISGEKIHLWH